MFCMKIFITSGPGCQSPNIKSALLGKNASELFPLRGVSNLNGGKIKIANLLPLKAYSFTLNRALRHLPVWGSVLAPFEIFVGVVDPPLLLPANVFGFLFRVCMPSFFIANGRFT